jgi:hypothetical protein
MSAALRPCRVGPGLQVSPGPCPKRISGSPFNLPVADSAFREAGSGILAQAGKKARAGKWIWLFADYFKLVSST